MKRTSRKITSALLAVILLLGLFPAQTVRAEETLTGPIKMVSLGGDHSAAITSDGSLWMWGFNKFGQLGDGTVTESLTPVKIMDSVASVSLGFYYSAAIKTDGSLWMLGSNSCGELGDGTTTDRHSPVKIMDGVTSVSLGSQHSAAIKTDGSLWTWGNNNFGKLGDGTDTNRLNPVKIMDGVASVSLGSFNGAAIKTDGSLWTWGTNGNGALGDGTTTEHRNPVKIMDGVASVSLGTNYGAAIKTDGSLWTWGRNSYGQLGDGTTTQRYTPVKIMDGVTSVSLGYQHSAAIKTDGSLWTWGNNSIGQLGDGTTTDRHSPVKIMDGVTSVSLDFYNSAAIKTDGSLWTWGMNSSHKEINPNGAQGQLGDGTTNDSPIPICIVEGVSRPTTPSRFEALDAIDYTWDEAKRFCESLGGHLATISSEEENQAAYQAMLACGYRSAYFGLTDETSEGSWSWVTKEPLSYTNWHSGEPNQYWGNEDYAQFYENYEDGTWNDGDFNELLGKAILCEWDSEAAYQAYKSRTVIPLKVHYGGGETRNRLDATFDEAYFSKTAYKYNHDLAWLTICLEAACWSRNENLFWGDDKYAETGNTTVDVEAYRTSFLQKMYSDMGFDADGRVFSKYDTSLNDTSNTVAFSIARKKMADGSTLVAVVLRGGGYGCEWSSNFIVGDGEQYHQAFLDCANNVYDTLIPYLNGIDGEIKLWITGYSRAAATANLLSAKLDDYADNTHKLNRENIYAYTFATPMGVTKNVSSVRDEKYNNIFNIVNPCDVVPKVAFSDWDFTRYGVTKFLAATTEQSASGDHNRLLIQCEQTLIRIIMQEFPDCKSSSRIQGVIFDLLKYLFTKKQVGDEWVSIDMTDMMEFMSLRYGNRFAGSYAKAKSFLKGGAVTAKRKSSTASDYILLFFTSCECNGIPCNEIEGLVLSLLTSNLPLIFDWDQFTAMPDLGTQHMPETYMSYLDRDELHAFSLTVDELRQKLLSFHCPVDIRVYDETGRLVAEIVDHEIVSAEIPVIINGESVDILLMGDTESYTFEVTPTDEGTMTYAVTELSEESGVERRVNYLDIPIAPNETYTVSASTGEYVEGQYDLTRMSAAGEETISADEVLTADYSVTLDVQISGDGTVTGAGSYIRGDTATLRAQPSTGNLFSGWYINGALVSSDAALRMEALESTVITAEFTENHCEHSWQETSSCDVLATSSSQTVATLWTCMICGESKVVESITIAVIIQPPLGGAPYTLTYDARGGTGAPEPSKISSSPLAEMPTVSNVLPVRNGYRFAGWTESKAGTTPEYQSGDVLKERKDTTLYAVWQPEPVSSERIVSVSQSSEKISAEISCSVPNVCVFFAAYDDNGRFIGGDISSVSLGRADAPSMEYADRIKIFLLDADACPLCRAGELPASD